MTISSTDRRVVYVAPTHFEAPNWSHDGRYFLFNSDGHILRLPVDGGSPTTIDTGFANRCNNDHGISPDATSAGDQRPVARRRQVAHLHAADRRRDAAPVTQRVPSYWHGWSPDGKTLAYCAERDGEFDIYTIPAGGGDETRLTTAKGLDDGPEYSPDGQYIYFNSERTGRCRSGACTPTAAARSRSPPTASTTGSPTSRPTASGWSFLSYEKDVTGHPANKDVQLRLMNLADGHVKVLARLFGGQGTINVPSWSPDSRKVAFVSYQLLPAEEAAAK